MDARRSRARAVETVGGRMKITRARRRRASVDSPRARGGVETMMWTDAGRVFSAARRRGRGLKTFSMEGSVKGDFADRGGARRRAEARGGARGRERRKERLTMMMCARDRG